MNDRVSIFSLSLNTGYYKHITKKLYVCLGIKVFYINFVLFYYHELKLTLNI